MDEQPTLADLKSVERLLGGLPQDKLREIARNDFCADHMSRWQPNPGPQTEAYNCKADCLLFGGEPGGGKSQLVLGLAFNAHQRSFIMRREYGDLERLIDDALDIHGSRNGFNGSPPPRLKINDDQTIWFRAAHLVGDEKGTMGQGRDLLGIDEATQFAESQVRFLMGWVRTETPGQRCRTVLATNPPLTAEGLWVKMMFAPWLDDAYSDPALPGELRWVVSDEDGKDLWVDGPDDAREINGKMHRPTSRTYIPSSTKDNPYYVDSDYERQLDAMPEPFRSLLMGGFKTEFKDHENQLIPTIWIKQAMTRWTPTGFKEFEMTAMGLDAAGGGSNEAVLSWRHGGWYAPLESVEGDATKDGSMMAAMVVKHRRANCPVVIDMGGGYGTDVMTRLKDNGVICQGFNGAETSTIIGENNMRFYNKRAAAYWDFREELNPDQEGGSVIALPDDPVLMADLAAVRIKEMKTRGLLLESKVEITKRLGRSTDRSDSVVMCLAPGNQAIRRQINSRRGGGGKINLGYANAKRRK